MRTVLLLLAASLALARSATVAPQDEQPPPPRPEDFAQREITFQDIPFQNLPGDVIEQKLVEDLRQEIIPHFLVHGEPQEELPPLLGPRGRRPACPRGSQCLRPTPRYRLNEFPPGRPTPDNIGTICSEGRQKISYGPWNLPQTGFSHLSRQGEALNNFEEGAGQCCQLGPDERLPCCQNVWEQSLNQFCEAEFGVKTRPHECCKEDAGEKRYDCFSRQAPFRSYDREVRTVSLAEITPTLLDSLCGESLLLTRQRNIPALIQNITDSCCKLADDERTQCAGEQKAQFITTLCTNQVKSWKDNKRCCALPEGEARDDCFGKNYLRGISLATAV